MSQQGRNVKVETPVKEGACFGRMAGFEKEAKKVVKQAEGALKKSSGGKKGSEGKKKGKGSGADKAKRAARELLK